MLYLIIFSIMLSNNMVFDNIIIMCISVYFIRMILCDSRNVMHFIMQKIHLSIKWRPVFVLLACSEIFRIKRKSRRKLSLFRFSHSPPGHTCGLPCCHDDLNLHVHTHAVRGGCLSVLNSHAAVETNFILCDNPKSTEENSLKSIQGSSGRYMGSSNVLISRASDDLFIHNNNGVKRCDNHVSKTNNVRSSVRPDTGGKQDQPINTEQQENATLIQYPLRRLQSWEYFQQRDIVFPDEIGTSLRVVLLGNLTGECRNYEDIRECDVINRLLDVSFQSTDRSNTVPPSTRTVCDTSIALPSSAKSIKSTDADELLTERGRVTYSGSVRSMPISVFDKLPKPTLKNPAPVLQKMQRSLLRSSRAQAENVLIEHKQISQANMTEISNNTYHIIADQLTLQTELMSTDSMDLYSTSCSDDHEYDVPFEHPRTSTGDVSVSPMSMLASYGSDQRLCLGNYSQTSFRDHFGFLDDSTYLITSDRFLCIERYSTFPSCQRHHVYETLLPRECLKIKDCAKNSNSHTQTSSTITEHNAADIEQWRRVNTPQLSFWEHTNSLCSDLKFTLSVDQCFPMTLRMAAKEVTKNSNLIDTGRDKSPMHKSESFVNLDIECPKYDNFKQIAFNNDTESFERDEDEKSDDVSPNRPGSTEVSISTMHDNIVNGDVLKDTIEVCSNNPITLIL